jgi:glycosyltransferase involved in cell wall biosynthesis
MTQSVGYERRVVIASISRTGLDAPEGAAATGLCAAGIRGSRKVCVMALSPIADDPRVRRQGDAFHDMGWEVVAVGLPGGRSPPPSWPILTRDDLPPDPPAEVPAATPAVPAATPAVPDPYVQKSLKTMLLKSYRAANRFVPVSERTWAGLEWVLKKIWGPTEDYVRIGVAGGRAALNIGGGRVRAILQRSLRIQSKLLSRHNPEVAEHRFWNMSSNITDVYACAKRVDAEIWLANDWLMLPIAARLAREKGGVYGYDTHEFATEEYAESLAWRLVQRPFVQAIEGHFVRGAAVVSAVSAGIAESLDRLYALPRETLVIRNMPAFEPVAFHPTAKDRIRVLYHGIVSPNRGIEATIDSVAAWRPEFDLTIRGPGEADFLDALSDRIRQKGLGDRVQLVPPVPMTALVREAAPFDIGFFALPGHSSHNQFALPNKFFEYTMAGLALCVTNLPEMARLIRDYDLGITFAKVDPAVIAASINALQPDQIDRYKQNALTAARDLCWDRESDRLVGAYEAVLQQTLARN